MRIGVNTLSGPPLAHAAHWHRYLVHVLRACGKLQADMRFVVFTNEENHHLFPDCERIQEEGRGLLRGGQAVKRAAIDALLAPLGEPVPSVDCPVFLYAFDLAAYEEGLEKPRRIAAAIKSARKACASAKLLIVPSEYLRHLCLERLEVPLNRIVVAKPGVAMDFEKPEATLVEEPYTVVYVDALVRRRLRTMQEGIDYLLAETGQSIVLVGPGYEDEPANWGDRFLRVEQLPNARMAGLYQHASLLLYVGEHDGSALPVMEALRARVPVVCAKSGAIQEVARNTPAYFNPQSPASLQHAMQRVLDEDAATRNARTLEGQQLVADASWEQCAWRFLSAFSKK